LKETDWEKKEFFNYVKLKKAQKAFNLNSERVKKIHYIREKKNYIRVKKKEKCHYIRELRESTITITTPRE